jgi:hypothetical protein
MVVPLTVINGAAGLLTLVYTFYTVNIKALSGISITLRHLLGIASAVAFVCDLSVAVVLCYFLYSRRSGRARSVLFNS